MNVELHVKWAFFCHLQRDKGALTYTLGSGNVKHFISLKLYPYIMSTLICGSVAYRKKRSMSALKVGNLTEGGFILGCAPGFKRS